MYNKTKTLGVIIMGKVYGYCRVAFKSEENMAQQCKMIEDYCKSNGLELVECYCDNGVSGLKLDRDALQMLLSVLREGDIVVVKDYARLSRDMHQCMDITESIYREGAVIKIINQ
jgi:DNA invertase Pin-like site-specific DNA recombinase